MEPVILAIEEYRKAHKMKPFTPHPKFARRLELCMPKHDICDDMEYANVTLSDTL